MKVAIVHDWFNEIGGAEKVVSEILFCYPEADVFCLFDFFDAEKRKKYLHNKKTFSTFIQHIPFAKKFYRFLFPLFPTAIEQLDLREYDLILSSSYCVAKGVKKTPTQLHICYCHSPVRYAWDLKKEYLNEVKSPFARFVFSLLLNRLKKWDKHTTSRVDYFIANSKNVAERIKQNYERASVVIYPPVDIHQFSPCTEKQTHFITVSRLVSYKRTELLLKAFESLPHLTLYVAGDGPNKEKLIKIAPPNVHVLGYVDSPQLIALIKTAKAFIAAANEDFGITIVEAQACGTPVIVPYMGGYKESVTPHTGLFFKEQSAAAIKEAILQFESEHKHYPPEAFTENVLIFKKERFHDELKHFVELKYNQFKHA